MPLSPARFHILRQAKATMVESICSSRKSNRKRKCTEGMMKNNLSIRPGDGTHLRRSRTAVLVLTGAFALMTLQSISVAKANTAFKTVAAPLDLRGRMAPNFTLKTPDDRSMSLSDFKGKAVLVNFWATWCPPCMIEMPWLVSLQKEHAAQGFTVIGISEDIMSIPRVGTMTRLMGVNYPIVIDDHSAAVAFGVGPLPASFYIGRDGRILIETFGRVSQSEIESNVRKIVGRPHRQGPISKAIPGPRVQMNAKKQRT